MKPVFNANAKLNFDNLKLLLQIGYPFIIPSIKLESTSFKWYGLSGLSYLPNNLTNQLLLFALQLSPISHKYGQTHNSK